MNPAEEVCELARLAEGKPLAVFPRGLPVLLVRRGSEVFALENRCPHMGCPLAAGALEGYTLSCPCHDWRLDIRDGKFLDAAEIRAKIYGVEITGGKVRVRI